MSPVSKAKAKAKAKTKSASGAAGKRRATGKSATAPGNRPGVRKAPVAAARADEAAVRAPRTLEELMRQALVMESEAAQRYAELADAMDTHNNREVAELFRKMADIEGKHAAQILSMMGWAEPPPPSNKPGWEGFEGPETVSSDEVHYLMQPYHALQLALINEQRAERFFAQLVRVARVQSVRKAARELQAEEHEHVALVRAWMKRVPRPDRDRADDPEPARYTD